MPMKLRMRNSVKQQLDVKMKKLDRTLNCFFKQITSGTFWEYFSEFWFKRCFRVTVVKDTNIVEICGALKNIVACAAGFCDGLKMGDNTKAAIIRLGLKEMIKYGDTFYPGGDHATYFESCGVADLITTCYGGRNRKVSEAFVVRKKSVAELETEMLNGQKLQGPETAAEVKIRSEEFA